jgi:hypothetical protein
MGGSGRFLLNVLRATMRLSRQAGGASALSFSAVSVPAPAPNNGRAIRLSAAKLPFSQFFFHLLGAQGIFRNQAGNVLIFAELACCNNAIQKKICRAHRPLSRPLCRDGHQCRLCNEIQMEYNCSHDLIVNLGEVCAAAGNDEDPYGVVCSGRVPVESV